jgi:peroxiredoxin
MNKNYVFLFMLLFTHAISAQSGYFKVEFDKFTPPSKEAIDAIEGKPAKNFMIKDLQGQDHLLSNYKGSKVILWFWTVSETNTAMLDRLSVLANQNKKIKFIALVNEAKEKVTAEYINAGYSFMSCPNAEFIGHALYDVDLGTPRMYLINEQGIVKMVLPTNILADENAAFNNIKNFIENKLN